MADSDYSSLGFLVAPDEAQALAMAKAKRDALRRRAPVAGALALTPDPTISRVGQSMLAEQGDFDQQMAQLLEARRREEDRRAQLDIARKHLALQQAGMLNGQWVPMPGGIDPDTGMPMPPAFMVNHRTGEVRPLTRPTGSPGPGTAPLPTSQPPAGPAPLTAGGMMPSHGPPSGYVPGLPTPQAPQPVGRPPPLPPMKLSPEQSKMGANIGGAIDAFHEALRVGFPQPGIAGLPQSLGQIASTHGIPALASPAAEQTQAAWYNVIRPLVNIRTGQQMSVQELLREFAALAPRPGEAPETMLMKVHLMPEMLRRYTVGLPPVYARRLNAEWDQIERDMPQSVADLQARRASGVPGQYVGGPGATTGTLGGRRVHQE